ncbi:MAG TPA: hypothetical protein VF715_13120 [Thermoleophilaceae bacterium]|jgi:hypothetical protein
MTRIRTRALGLAAALAIAAAAPIAGGSAEPIAAAHTCKSGKHAVIGGKHKCLRRGQFCSRSKDGQYHKYGFHCHKRDKKGNYHLS